MKRSRRGHQFGRFPGRHQHGGGLIAARVPKSQRRNPGLKLHRLEFTILVEPRKTEFSAVSGFFVSTGGQGEVRIPVRRFAFLRTFQLKRALPATTQGSAPLPRGPPMPDSSLLAPWSHFFRRTRDGAWKCITLSSLTSMPHSHQWIGDGSARIFWSGRPGRR
jgi:hypothetical protein